MTSIWMGGSPDWTALNLQLNQPFAYSMSQAEKVMRHWRETLNDLWNIHGLMFSTGLGYDGLPWCTSHYGFHMVLWHIPFAVSGQDFSMVNQSLTFAPKVQQPLKLPVLIPKTYGFLYMNNNVCTLEIIMGQALSLRQLTVYSSSYRINSPPLILQPGQSVSWSCSQ